MSHPRFPLGEDQSYRLGAYTPEGQAAFWLTAAQRMLNIRWGYKHVIPTGRMDASTSAAICQVQKTIDHKPNGELDKETWDQIFKGNP